MTCQMCGKRQHQEMLKEDGKTILVCRQCGNAVRAKRRPKQAAAKEARRAAARAERLKQQSEAVEAVVEEKAQAEVEA